MSGEKGRLFAASCLSCLYIFKASVSGCAQASILLLCFFFLNFVLHML